MDANHTRKRRPRLDRAPLPPAATTEVRNTQAVLDLGNLKAFLFRGQPFGVPPIGWKDGQRLVLLQASFNQYLSKQLDESAARGYFAAVAQVAPLLWQLTRPVGKIRRLMKRLGLHRNPFQEATEAELGQLLSFFQACRTMSSIGQLPAGSQLGSMTF